MALLRQAYSSLFRRTSTFALSIVLGAVVFERAFDQGADAIFEHLNEGVRPGPEPIPTRGRALKVSAALPAPHGAAAEASGVVFGAQGSVLRGRRGAARAGWSCPESCVGCSGSERAQRAAGNSTERGGVTLLEELCQER